MHELPTGAVTFSFTDIEGSAKLVQQYPDARPALPARHNETLNHAIAAHNGFVFRVTGERLQGESIVDVIPKRKEHREEIIHDR